MLFTKSLFRNNRRVFIDDNKDEKEEKRKEKKKEKEKKKSNSDDNYINNISKCNINDYNNAQLF